MIFLMNERMKAIGAYNDYEEFKMSG